jgi:hypothetical protein
MICWVTALTSANSRVCDFRKRYLLYTSYPRYLLYTSYRDTELFTHDRVKVYSRLESSTSSFLVLVPGCISLITYLLMFSMLINLLLVVLLLLGTLDRPGARDILMFSMLIKPPLLG